MLVDIRQLTSNDVLLIESLTTLGEAFEEALHFDIAVDGDLNGERLLAEHGVVILDYSADLGEVEVHALGIGYSLYQHLFPQHVEAYANQFR